jgi:hypothetical protein
LPEASADAAAEALTLSGTDLWGSTALVTSDEQTVAWFLGGTLPGSQDTPLVVVVLLESSAPQLAQQIGRDILQSALQASLK